MLYCRSLSSEEQLWLITTYIPVKRSSVILLSSLVIIRNSLGSTAVRLRVSLLFELPVRVPYFRLSKNTKKYNNSFWSNYVYTGCYNDPIRSVRRVLRTAFRTTVRYFDFLKLFMYDISPLGLLVTQLYACVPNRRNLGQPLICVCICDAVMHYSRKQWGRKSQQVMEPTKMLLLPGEVSPHPNDPVEVRRLMFQTPGLLWSWKTCHFVFVANRKAFVDLWRGLGTGIVRPCIRMVRNKKHVHYDTRLMAAVTSWYWYFCCNCRSLYWQRFRAFHCLSVLFPPVFPRTASNVQISAQSFFQIPFVIEIASVNAFQAVSLSIRWCCLQWMLVISRQ